MYSLDPQDLPYVNASVERFVLNPCGAADGMILSNGLEVQFSSHWSGSRTGCNCSRGCGADLRGTLRFGRADLGSADRNRQRRTNSRAAELGVGIPARAVVTLSA
jgi:hypothetical protein